MSFQGRVIGGRIGTKTSSDVYHYNIKELHNNNKNNKIISNMSVSYQNV